MTHWHPFSAVASQTNASALRYAHMSIAAWAFIRGAHLFGNDFVDCTAVSAEEVDAYLRDLEEPKRSTLETLRRTILEIVPQAEQVISYGVPAFRVGGTTVAGMAAFKNHLSYLPFSGSVFAQLADELDGYTMTKGSLHFPVDRALSKALVGRLIAVRLAEAGQRAR